MADKATTDKTTADTVAVPDTAGAVDEGAATPPAKIEPATPPVRPTGRASSRRTSKGDKESPEARFEEYISHKPDGNGGHTEVTVRRNIDTGASEIVDG
ncbi:hypothetical protein G8767_31740 [Rhodococcus sp. IC4_135]|uniref:hypothetical protein n=1 Tax=Rhodococcus sp. IC4_135 TaxID=2715537 RepID=UPI0014213836|nr:hypothetical protein [Rhodococcus sp. IC4_135]